MGIIIVQLSARASPTLKATAEVLSTQFAKKKKTTTPSTAMPKSSGDCFQPGSRKLDICDRNC